MTLLAHVASPETHVVAFLMAVAALAAGYVLGRAAARRERDADRRPRD